MKSKNIYCVLVGTFMILLGLTSFLVSSLNWEGVLYTIGGIMCFIAIKRNIFLLFSGICFFLAAIYIIAAESYSTAFLLSIIFWILNIAFYEDTRKN